MTDEQMGCLVEFLNFMDADQSAYFADIDPSQNPVLYRMVDTADATAGMDFYDGNCMVCHGDPAEDDQGGSGGVPEGGILAYLAKDGKFSEFSHKARWGIPGSSMSFGSIGSPTSANVADMMLYLQELGGTGFGINSGLSGHWWNGEDRSGEGFLVDASSNDAGDMVLVVSFYTYDTMGNQVWLIGSGQIDHNTATLNMTIPSGGMWGEGYSDAGEPTEWGTGTFTFNSCDAGHISLEPNSEMVAMDFTALEYDINRSLLIPGVKCPG